MLSGGPKAGELGGNVASMDKCDDEDMSLLIWKQTVIHRCGRGIPCPLIVLVLSRLGGK